MSNNNNNYRCPKCGESNTGVSHFCFACGTRLLNDEADAVMGEYEKVDVPYDIATNTDEPEAIDDSVEVVDSLDEVVSDETLSNPYLLWKHDPTARVASDELKKSPDDIHEEIPEDIHVDMPKSDLEAMTPDISEDAPEDKVDNITSEEAPKAEEPKAQNLKSNEKKPTQKKSNPAPTVKKIPKGAGKSVVLMLLLSVILLFAFVAPLASVETAYNDNSSCEVSFSPADFVSFGVSMVKAYVTNYKFTSEYQEYSRLKSSVLNIDLSRTLSEYQRSTYEQYIKASFRVKLMENVALFKANELVVMLASVILAVMAFVSLIRSFALSAVYALSNHKAFHKLFGRLKKTLTIIITVLPFYLILFLRTSRMSHGYEVDSFGNVGASLTFYGVVLCVLVALALIVKSRGCFVYLSKKAATSTDRMEKRRALALVCLIVAFLAMILPFVTVKTASETYGYVAQRNFHIGAGEIYEYSTGDYQYFTAESEKTTAEDFVKKIERAADGNTGIIPMGKYAFDYVLFKYHKDADVLYTFAGIVSSVSILLISIFISRLVSAMNAKQPVKKQTRMMAFSIMCTLAYTVFGISMAGVCNMNMSIDMARNLLFSVGIGPILAFIFTVLAVVLLVIKDKKSEYREYDNPDVSYDPYIV